MFLRFFTLAVVFLLSCTDFERSNPFDANGINYGNGNDNGYGNGDDYWEGAEVEEVEFKFSDPRDKKVYNAIEFRVKIKDNPKYKITGQEKEFSISWMTQNLNFNAPGSVCYDNVEANCAINGRLYDFETAKTACPSGWRLPVDGEEKLATYENYSDGQKWENNMSSYLSRRFGYESCYKSAPYQSSNGEIHNTCVGRWIVGLGGLGYSNDNFSDIDTDGYWWTSTEGKAGYAYSLHGKPTVSSSKYEDGTVDYYPEIKKGSHEKNNFLSVHCVQD